RRAQVQRHQRGVPAGDLEGEAHVLAPARVGGPAPREQPLFLQLGHQLLGRRRTQPLVLVLGVLADHGVQVPLTGPGQPQPCGFPPPAPATPTRAGPVFPALPPRPRAPSSFTFRGAAGGSASRRARTCSSRSPSSLYRNPPTPSASSADSAASSSAALSAADG